MHTGIFSGATACEKGHEPCVRALTAAQAAVGAASAGAGSPRAARATSERCLEHLVVEGINDDEALFGSSKEDNPYADLDKVKREIKRMVMVGGKRRPVTFMERIYNVMFNKKPLNTRRNNERLLELLNTGSSQLECSAFDPCLYRKLPGIDQRQQTSAKIMQRSNLIIMPLVFGSFTSGTLAAYEQNPGLYGTFTLLNGLLGGSVFFFHCTGNERVSLRELMRCIELNCSIIP